MMRLWLGGTYSNQGKSFKYYHTTTQQTTNNALLNLIKSLSKSPQTARKGVVSGISRGSEERCFLFLAVDFSADMRSGTLRLI